MDGLLKNNNTFTVNKSRCKNIVFKVHPPKEDFLKVKEMNFLFLHIVLHRLLKVTMSKYAGHNRKKIFFDLIVSNYHLKNF